MSLDAMINHDAARSAIAAAMGMDLTLGKALVQYLALFRPSKRSLSFDRVAALLEELVPMVQAGKVTRNGQHYAAPRESWKLAIETVLASRGTLQLPLKSHGYLLAVLIGAAEKLEAKLEQAKEAQRQGVAGAGSHRQDVVQGVTKLEVPQPKQPMPESVRQALKPKPK
ncbi:hypothetical protein [Undibacterium danionis]|uniref:Uncharacterized protein n=1 Tax=Undibacterium danionis TaxID=1812100 RepID=A0ABV6ID10_9BURK